MIMSWLSESMESSISNTCMIYRTLKSYETIFITLTPRLGEAVQTYEIKITTRAMMQEGKTVSEYAIAQITLWQELNYHSVFKMKFTTNVVILKKFIEADRVYDFLAGLDNQFDQVCVQIIKKRGNTVPRRNNVPHSSK